MYRMLFLLLTDFCEKRKRQRNENETSLLPVQQWERTFCLNNVYMAINCRGDKKSGVLLFCTKKRLHLSSSVISISCHRQYELSVVLKLQRKKIWNNRLCARELRNYTEICLITTKLKKYVVKMWNWWNMSKYALSILSISADFHQIL